MSNILANLLGPLCVLAIYIRRIYIKLQQSWAETDKISNGQILNGQMTHGEARRRREAKFANISIVTVVFYVLFHFPRLVSNICETIYDVEQMPEALTLLILQIALCRSRLTTIMNSLYRESRLHPQAPLKKMDPNCCAV